MKKAKSRKEKTGKEESGFEPRIIAFVCKWCSATEGTSQEEGGISKHALPGCVRLVSVMCSGRVDPSLVLKAFELGADGVIVCGCKPGQCHYTFGNEKQAEMFETSKRLANVLGLEPERLRLEWLSGDGADGLSGLMNEFTQEIMRVGPSPLRKSGEMG